MKEKIVSLLHDLRQIFTPKKIFFSTVFRPRADMCVQKKFSTCAWWLAAVNTPEFRAFIHAPDDVFQAKDAHFFKRGNSRTVVKIEINGKPYMIKRYNLKNKRYALSRLLRPSAAAHAWRMAHLLQFLNIPTVPPVALIEKRWGPLRREAYFVTEFLEGAVFEHLPYSQVLQAKALAQIANMHAENITHGDLKAANILISNEEAVIIDLDSAKLHSWSFLKARRAAKDYARFLHASKQPQRGVSCSTFSHSFSYSWLLLEVIGI